MLFKNLTIRWPYLLSSTLYLLVFYFFYLKYVPLVAAFQIVLVPVLCAVFVLTVININWGLLFFIFSFPLVNNLPYFFGIYGHIPHAPTALVLFLVFFFGWLVHLTFSTERISFKHPIFKPILFLTLFIVISCTITSLRYANFFPFLSDRIYELITNTNRVTAGGAIMSSVFSSLNYLSGFAFLLILLNTVKERKFVKKILVVWLISTFLATAFGFFQHYINIELANNPISFTQGFINGTFKDAMSFGANFAALVPVMVSMFFFFKGAHKVFPLLTFISAVFILPHTGSRSCLIALFISFVFFIGFYFVNLFKKRIFSIKKIASFGVVVVMITAILVTILISSKDSVVYKRLDELRLAYKEGGLDKALAERSASQWRLAARMMKDYPISGVGAGAYIIELPNYAQKAGISLRTTDSAENYFLQVGSELGFLGLFFSLWIFWLILRQIKKVSTKYLSMGRWKYIQIGILCGIISLFVIFFVHTFIGSYEIKYTFWLLVGFLFILGEKRERQKDRRLFHKILIIVLFLIFGGTFLWNSAHSLSLKNRTEVFHLEQDFGFYRLERDQQGRQFQWTKRYAGMTIKIKSPVLEIPLLASHPDIDKNSLRVKIYLIKDFFKEKRMLDELVLTDQRWTTYEYTMAEDVGLQAILLFEVSRTWNPSKTSGSADHRDLGIAIGTINFKTLNF